MSANVTTVKLLTDVWISVYTNYFLMFLKLFCIKAESVINYLQTENVIWEVL